MKKIMCSILLFALLFNFTACSSQLSNNDVSKVNYPSQGELERYKNKEFIDCINSFSSKTAYEIFNDEEFKSKNINYSPISVYFAMSLLCTGANNQTEKELLDLLCLEGKDKNYLSEECAKLYKGLYRDNEEGKLLLANSLWMQNNIEFKKEYIENSEKYFYTSLYNIDFANQNDVNLISEWISNNTNNLLKPKFESNPETILAIINTIYFNTRWKSEFNKKNNYNDVFNITDDETTDCEFMHQNFNTHSYLKGEGYVSTCLYLNEGTMHFILPDKNVKVDDLIKSEDKLNSMMTDILNKDERIFAQVNFDIPKFKIKSDIYLNEIIKNLGCESVFVNSDFSDMTNGMAYVSLIKQGNYLSVDEEGVEAAAYTAVCENGCAMPAENIFDFKLDRPFIYIVTSDNGTILFMGICNNPSVE
ncbi:hypothetical protein JYG23_01060 [Sedimentibacter sp. zth1]|uniref:serpin family protein n=1 Tax=Sedimentibacter sp. zth1 TaxID=2816908 RepID=UPI001A91200C|nr:serpin family protein [Sedimentibacter sp. zth1]QSX06086.1 hypothetical protein JYG23_01060 [Sedimentibacter sp. zth1]